MQLEQSNLYLVVSGSKEDLENDNFGLSNVFGAFNSQKEAEEGIEELKRLKICMIFETHFKIVCLNVWCRQRYEMLEVLSKRG